MNFKENAISAAVTKQFKPAHFLFILKHLHFGTVQWEWGCQCDCHQILPQRKPTALARQPGHKYKGTILSTSEKVRTYLLSFQNFLHDHICKRGSEWRGLLDHFTQRYNEFHAVLFKPSHNFTYKFNLSEVAWWFNPLGRRILVKSFKWIINILSYKGKINS